MSEFSHLKNKNLYAAALLKDRDNDRTLLGIVGMPESVPPILFLPGRNTEFVRTEDVLLSHLRKIFRIYKIDSSVWNCRVKPLDWNRCCGKCSNWNQISAIPAPVR